MNSSMNRNEDGKSERKQEERGRDRIASDEIDEENLRELVREKRRACIYMYIYLEIPWLLRIPSFAVCLFVFPRFIHLTESGLPPARPSSAMLLLLPSLSCSLALSIYPSSSSLSWIPLLSSSVLLCRPLSPSSRLSSFNWFLKTRWGSRMWLERMQFFLLLAPLSSSAPSPRLRRSLRCYSRIFFFLFFPSTTTSTTTMMRKSSMTTTTTTTTTNTKITRTT